jgi:adenylate kinase family enzyme
LILVGPEKCGKTTVANYLAQEHQRGVVQLNKLYDWHLKRGTALAEKAKAYLEKRDADLQEAIAEQEKKKKQKKKKGEEDDVFNPDEYKYIEKDLLIEMLKERLQQEDCNAGAIFDDLHCENWPDEKFAIEFITEANPLNNVQVIMFKFQKEQVGETEEDTVDVCTNYRYIKRRDGLNTDQPHKDEAKQGDELLNSKRRQTRPVKGR